MKSNQANEGALNSEVILPGITEIYQPNRVTNGKHKSLSVLQSRILLLLIKELQAAILASMNGKDWVQLNLFEVSEKGLIRVPIKLKELTTSNHYHSIYEAVLELAKTNVKLPSSVGKDYYCIAVLFPKVHLPIIENGYSIIYVELFIEAARKLIEVDILPSRKPGYFTKYLYEVAMSAKNKYTYKLYMIISSWKSKGGFRITLESLKELLGIPKDKYIHYREFKKRVLVPVQKDLEFKSDCWFNCNVSGFEGRSGKSVIYLNFKIIIPAAAKLVKERKDHILYLLRSHFLFSDLHIKSISDLLESITDQETFQFLLLKLQELKQYITSRRGTHKEVSNIPNYVLSVLKKLIVPE